MGEAHRAFTSMERVIQRTTTNYDNKVSKLIDQLKARTDEFTAATNKTMNAINPTETLVARMRAYGTAGSVGVFIGAAVTAGVSGAMEGRGLKNLAGPVPLAAPEGARRALVVALKRVRQRAHMPAPRRRERRTAGIAC